MVFPFEAGEFINSVSVLGFGSADYFETCLGFSL